MEFREVVGDLFACPVTHSLAHCVSEDLKMGKGIAAIFKRQFGGIDTLSMQKASVGNVAILEHRGRYVYYLVTKKMFYHKPKYEQLRASLEAMKKHCLENNVTKLAMPRIGCGLDGLEWREVSNVIKEVFGDTNISITVYSLG